MKLLNRRNLQVANFTSKEDSRYTLSNVLVTDKETVATDGHMLARVSLPAVDVNDFPAVQGFNPNGYVGGQVLVSRDQLKQLEAALPKKANRPILETIAISTQDSNQVQFATPDHVIYGRSEAGQFPNWEAPFPHGSEQKFDITVDATLLKRLADAAVKFSDNREMKAIRFRFYGKDRPLRFDMVNSDGQELSGLLMPVNNTAVNPEWRRQLDAPPTRVNDPETTLDTIYNLMDGKEWTSTTLSEIAGAMKAAGWPVKEPNDPNDPATTPTTATTPDHSMELTSRSLND